ncbi:60S ribosomal protein L14 [Folsomia candida]|uniref:60S ribosomal protein L14 n=1 Tax=Folsomia candida TaxID=158441 RepID=UPI000B9085F1|nr:60S ribosomal protein L14 [Folsomia candida]
MAFRKFVETGRVAFIADGPNEGKLCAIVNIIDQNRVLVDGPLTGITRQEMSLKKLHLTTLGVKFPWTAPTRVVRKAWIAEKIDEKWKASRWAQRVAARKIRQNLTDFERFKLNSARRTRNKLRRNVYLSLLTKTKKSTGGILKPRKSRNGKKKAGARKK